MAAELVLLLTTATLTIGPFVALVFFLIAQQRNLRVGGRYGADMRPGLVWLQLIPIFSLGWQFYVLSCATRGIKGWAAAKREDVGDAGSAIGLSCCILSCVHLVSYCVAPLNCLVSPAVLITWIIYWVKLVRFTQRMEREGCPCGYLVQPWQFVCPECGRANDFVPEAAPQHFLAPIPIDASAPPPPPVDSRQTPS